jgi:transposase
MVRATKGPRRSAAEWQSVMDRQATSGLSRIAFCKRDGISLTSFDSWRRRLAAREPMADFVDVTPKPAGWDVEVALPNGVVLRFRG